MTNILSQDKLEKLKQKFLLNDVVFAALFGSYAKRQPTENSDVDILIKYKTGKSPGLFGFIGLAHQLEDVLNKKVDLVTVNSLNKYIKNEVLSTMQTIYER